MGRKRNKNKNKFTGIVKHNNTEYSRLKYLILNNQGSKHQQNQIAVLKSRFIRKLINVHI